MPRPLVLAACFAAALGARRARKQAKHQGEVATFAGVPVHNYRANAKDWVLQFKKGHVSDLTLKKACKGKCTLTSHPDEGSAALAAVHGDESEIIEIIRENPDLVEFVEFDDIVSIIPDVDEGEADDEDRAGLTRWNLDRVGVRQRPNAGEGTHIYVLDTGVRVSHTDFEGRAIPTIDFDKESGELIECGGDVNCAVDRHGHGTHCAGSAGGKQMGVASAATIHAMRVMKDDGKGKFSAILGAIDWVVAKGPKPAVISMSLGGKSNGKAYVPLIGEATAQGVVVVAAAGNSNEDACSHAPALLTDVITVGATTRAFGVKKNARASYSNYGKCNDIFAPGSHITSTGIKSDTSAKTMTGTSMACPHVAGAAALLLATNPGLKKNDVLKRMQKSGKKGIKGLTGGDPDVFLWVGR